MRCVFINESIEQSLLCVPKSNNKRKDENFVLKFLFLFIDIKRIPFNLRRIRNFDISICCSAPVFILSTSPPDRL